MQNFLINYLNDKPEKMISYAEYMNLVLYHPKLGYYMREGEKIGRNGDYITSSNMADIFGRTFARWYAGQVKIQSYSPQVCEMGAGNGRFAKAFLEEWYGSGNPEINYFILEKSPYHIKQQKELFEEKWKVHQIEDLAELREFNGLFFSNELFDALPVHVVKKQQGQLFEIMVSSERDQLTETEVPLRNEEIYAFIAQHKVMIAEGQRIEIPLNMEEIILQIDEVLTEGMIVTVDYGYTNDEWKEPIRRDGSLRGYYQHRLINNVLMNPGEMDLTSHIHWDALENIGEKYHFRKVGKWRQDEFLLSIGILDELESHNDPNPFSEVNKRNRAIRSLIMPSGISTAFQVLVQEKRSRLGQGRQA
ncbi:SAM-dependent methyltransferase [Bacillus sp. V3B]|uniref:class I SAM-dependent methyltransferase n=1 Tax=Bacillus sp. V3B TaxID=2804915 RepID=UPI00210A736D|nr:SAM-dependent methyltransferase [Bacillus sp. V3B]MCQ6273710.1 SAM-dependent methyltransferase [Bacillus sp. V3B]